MRRFFVASALGAALLALGSPGVQADKVDPAGSEGCIAVSAPVPAAAPGQQLVYGGSCNYVASRTNGYATASNGWSIKVWSNNSPTKTLVAEYGSGKGSKPCNTSPVIQPGNFVEVRVTAQGVAAAGNPFPQAADTGNPTPNGCANLP